MMKDARRFETSLLGDVKQALGHMFEETDGSEAATQIRVRNTSDMEHTAEIEYWAPQACGGPSPLTLANEVSRQVKDSWSKLRLVGKYSSFAVGHVLVKEDCVSTTKGERFLMRQFCRLWYDTAQKQTRIQEKYSRALKRMRNLLLAGAFEMWLEQNNRNQYQRLSLIHI